MVGSRVILIVSISTSQNPRHANHSAPTSHSTHQTQKVCCLSNRKSELPVATDHRLPELAAVLAAATTSYRHAIEQISIESARWRSPNALRPLRLFRQWSVVSRSKTPSLSTPEDSRRHHHYYNHPCFSSFLSLPFFFFSSFFFLFIIIIIIIITSTTHFFIYYYL